MKRFIFVAISALCIWQANAHAEVVTLKSGKTVEGKIIERTKESVKIDFDGVPLTYYIDEIESIDGVQVGAPLAKEPALPAEPIHVSAGEVYTNREFYFKIKTPEGWETKEDKFQKEAVSILSLGFTKLSTNPEVKNSFLITVSMVDVANKPVKRGEEFIAYADEAIDSATRNFEKTGFVKETVSVNGVTVRRATFGWTDPNDHNSYRGALIFFEPQIADTKAIIGFAFVKTLSQDYEALQPHIEEAFSSIEIGK